MYYMGIDYHKRYSFVSSQDTSGTIILERKIDHNDPRLFADFAFPGSDRNGA